MPKMAGRLQLNVPGLGRHGVLSCRISSLALRKRAPRSASVSLLAGRAFSASPRARKASQASLSFDRLKVNQSRLLTDLHHTCQWGTGARWGTAADETGMSRLALTDADKLARDWFVRTTKALGCTVTVDAMGNIFAVRKGMRDDGPPTFAGSHLDTQPSGGRYDGILGIHAAVEMLKVMEENNFRTEYPVGVVNWTNEEGARFPISMVSSGVWAGEIPLARAHALQEVGGGAATMRSELERIGYLGATPASYDATPMAAHFELHIEQGPALETRGQKIGVVTGVQAYRWYTVDVVGREAHTGTTPLESRADALAAAVRMVALSRDRAAARGALASTGILTLEPGSVNTFPGRVRFSLDVRAAEDGTVAALEEELKREFALVASEPSSGLPVAVSWRTDSDSPATRFHGACIGAVREAAAAVLGTPDLSREMVSGAGHDSVYTSRRCPTSMIFVPSRNGVSHHPEEWTSPEDCAIGAAVLMQSVLRFDRMRAT